MDSKENAGMMHKAGAAKGGMNNESSSALAQAGVRAEPVKLPSTPEEMIAFIGSQFEVREDAEDPSRVRFQLTVHDLLSAFDWWFDGAATTIPAQVPAAEVPLWDDNGEPWNEAAEKIERQRAQSGADKASEVRTAYEQAAQLMEAKDDGIWANTCGPAIRALAQSVGADKASEVRAAEWISVEDRLPEVGQQVIAYRPTAEQTIDPLLTFVRYTGMMRDSWQGVQHGFDCICHPTHWMPLPAIPSTADSGNTDEKGGDK